MTSRCRIEAYCLILLHCADNCHPGAASLNVPGAIFWAVWLRWAASGALGRLGANLGPEAFGIDDDARMTALADDLRVVARLDIEH